MNPTWTSGIGFLLATVGSAIGLGNVWRFSYLAGENGGAAFILVYVAAVVLVGIPLLLVEFSVGKAGGPDPTVAFPRLSGMRRTAVLGWLPVVTCSLALAYYAVVAGWVARYLALAFTGQVIVPPADGFGAGFDEFRARPLEPLLWQALVMAATGTIVAAGVEAGIERLCKTALPILGLIIIGLATYSLTLPGSGRGIAFMLQPDWSALARPQVWLMALGQAFFSLSVGFGVMLIYGAYAGSEQSLPGIAVGAAIADTAFALITGVAVFGAVFAFGLDPQSGPALAFITLPEVFAVMPGGWFVAIAFFGLLLLAALTSTIGLLEVGVAVLTRRTGLSRRSMTWLLTVGIFLLGVPAALADGPLRQVTVFGVTLLTVYDRFAGEVLLPLSALLFALFVGWRWSAKEAIEASELGPVLGRWWLALVRYVIPVVIASLFVGVLWYGAQVAAHFGLPYSGHRARRSAPAGRGRVPHATLHGW